ncbi:uncharacterized protein LOC130769374 [Actinidia eriantha]|uniref:uncharacterized protein LOC130769374 n=1 Tax=Actinidia eriantha TaxID=165200 RepID=UPI00258D9A18|nr:uncharacterized protein LOC130769374 [Actinidia eriantha]
MTATARSAFPSVSSLSSSTTNATRAGGPICSNFFTPNFVSKIKPSRLRISRKIGIVQNHVFRAPIACCLDDDRFEATSESAPASATDDLMELPGQQQLLQSLATFRRILPAAAVQFLRSVARSQKRSWCRRGYKYQCRGWCLNRW